MKLCAQKWKFAQKCLFFFFVPKVCSSAHNETKMFLGYLGHGFVFASKKLDSLIGILGKKFCVWYTVVDTFALARWGYK